MTVEQHRVAGRAGALHGRDIVSLLPDDPGGVALWRLDLDRPAVALGSRQTVATVDAERCERLGIDVVRRRSGCVLVHLVPGEVVWVDVVVGADHPVSSLDVRQSMIWMGERWRGAIEVSGAARTLGRLELHRGPEQRSAWSDLVCFAGLGPGEVHVAGAKVVGISQRRTRRGARFQCAVLHRYDPTGFVDLFAVPTPDRSLLPPVVTVAPEFADGLVAALVGALAAAA